MNLPRRLLLSGLLLGMSMLTHANPALPYDESADARADLGKHTRKKLVSSLGLQQKDDVDSLLRFLDSDIELSISRILMSR